MKSVSGVSKKQIDIFMILIMKLNFFSHKKNRLHTGATDVIKLKINLKGEHFHARATNRCPEAILAFSTVWPWSGPWSNDKPDLDFVKMYPPYQKWRTKHQLQEDRHINTHRHYKALHACIRERKQKIVYW